MSTKKLKRRRFNRFIYVKMFDVAMLLLFIFIHASQIRFVEITVHKVEDIKA